MQVILAGKEGEFLGKEDEDSNPGEQEQAPDAAFPRC